MAPMRIGEFSTASGVPIKTLRYYDEIGLFRPAGKDPLTRYRAYDASQLSELTAILALRELGVSLADIQRAMRRPAEKRMLLERAAQDLRRSIDCRSRTLRWLEAELHRDGDALPVVLRQRPSIEIASIRATLGASSDVIELERELLALVPQSCRGAIRGSLWHQCDETTGTVEAEHFVEIVRAPPRRRGLALGRLPAVTAACAFSADSEDDARRAFADVRRWMSARGHELAAAKRELYWPGRLEVQFPVECAFVSEGES